MVVGWRDGGLTLISVMWFAIGRDSNRSFLTQVKSIKFKVFSPDSGRVRGIVDRGLRQHDDF